MLGNDRSKIIGCCLLLAHLALASQVAGEELRRRGLIGVSLRTVSEKPKEGMGVASANGLQILAVMPDSAAALADLHENDVIIKIGSDRTPNLREGLQSLRKYFAGDTIELTLLRDGKEKRISVTLRQKPREEWTGIKLIYDQAGTTGRYVRTLITTPTGPGRYPAILFIQSLAPRSIELAFPVPHPYRKLIEAFTKKGFVFMRVDRLGTGDSDGLNAEDTTVEMDVRAFSSALAKLKTYEFVDPNRVFILAYSSGSAIAPIVARAHAVKGVLTYATMARPWDTQAVEMMRRRWAFELLSKEEIETNTKKLKRFLDLSFVRNQPLSEIFAEDVELADFVRRSKLVQDNSSVFGMPIRFGRELMGLEIENSWAKVDAPVLAIWGEADFIASREDSERVIAAVNRAHPGNGTFMALPGICHMCCKAEDQEESFLAGLGEFNPILVETATDWIHAQTKDDDF